MTDPTLVVLDDDPTGTQLVHDVPVLLDVFDDDARRKAFAGQPKAVHVVTNSRALDPADVTQLIVDTLDVLDDVAANAPVLLRGDSTLRAHLLEEYAGVCAARHNTDPAVPLLLVPALPSAGRVTIGGVHSLIRDGQTVALHDTEYASDGVFAYPDAHLLRWAEQRSGGQFVAADGVTCDTQTLVDGGAAYVADVLKRLHTSGMKAVFAPDVTDLSHLEIVSEGVRLAVQHGTPHVIRAAPAFAAVHAKTRATTPVIPAKANGIIVMVGSYVPTTTRQLHHLLTHLHTHPIVADVIALSSDDASIEQRRLARAIDDALHTAGIAIVATPRQRPETTINLAAGERIATNYAATLQHVTATFDTVIAKGGITSTLTAQIGLNAAHAMVIGPALTGVAQWQIDRNGSPVNYFVVPGNVGDDACLTDLVGLLR